MSASIERCGRHDGVHGPGGPSVFGILPLHGPFGGATPVTITGRGFTGATHASVGGTNIGAFAVVDDSTITGTSPAGAHGFADVVVGGGPPGDITLANAYHYDQNPTVTSVQPQAHGPIGGSAREIHGSGMTGMTGALAGAVPCGPDFNVISDVRVDTEFPAHSWGDVNVTVNGLFGETGTLVNGFHYDQPIASVDTCAPDHGSSAGGTAITLTGTNFLTVVSAALTDGTPLTSVVVVDDNTITAVTPAHADGFNGIKVTNDSGDSPSLVNAFDFQTPAFDPATLNATMWQRGSFAGLPWLGSASAGTSGARKDATKSGTDATAGATLDGFVSARYGQTKNSVLELVSNSSHVAATDVITFHEYTVMGLIFVTSAAAAQSPAYLNGTAFQCDAFQSIGLTSTGIGVQHYDGGFPYVEAPAAIGAWHFFCARFGGVIGAAKVQIDIDNVAGAPTPLSLISSLGAEDVTKGVGTFNGGTAWSVDEMEMMALQVAISDAQRDGYYSYLKARYPSAGLP